MASVAVAAGCVVASAEAAATALAVAGATAEAAAIANELQRFQTAGAAEAENNDRAVRCARIAHRPASTRASILVFGISNSVVPYPFAGSRQT
jgi:hypothetical protein